MNEVAHDEFRDGEPSGDSGPVTLERQETGEHQEGEPVISVEQIVAALQKDLSMYPVIQKVLGKQGELQTLQTSIEATVAELEGLAALESFSDDEDALHMHLLGKAQDGLLHLKLLCGKDITAEQQGMIAGWEARLKAMLPVFGIKPRPLARRKDADVPRPSF